MKNNQSDVKQESALVNSTETKTKTQSSDKASASDPELRRSITKSGNESGEKVRDPLDIMKDLLNLGNDDKGNNLESGDKDNRLKLRPETIAEKEGDNSDLMIKMMFGIAGLALIAASGGAGIAVMAGGAAMTPILPKILEMGKEFLLGEDKKDGKDGDLQTISQDSLVNPIKMLALSLFEFANSGKSELADLIFNKENPLGEINPYVKNIKDYTGSLSTMDLDQRAIELVSLRVEVKKIALASTQPNLSEKIDAVFVGLSEVLEGKNLEKKEGERDILGELKKNLSARGIINKDGSVTIMESETSKKKGEEGKEVPSPAPASRGEENKSAPRAEPIKGLEESKSASGGRELP
jgi:hypothetical protein